MWVFAIMWICWRSPTYDLDHTGLEDRLYLDFLLVRFMPTMLVCPLFDSRMSNMLVI